MASRAPRYGDNSYVCRIGLNDDGTFWFTADHLTTRIGTGDQYKTEKDAERAATRECKAHKEGERRRATANKYPKTFYPFE